MLMCQLFIDGHKALLFCLDRTEAALFYYIYRSYRFEVLRSSIIIGVQFRQ
jgi:hypothetical protein